MKKYLLILGFTLVCAYLAPAPLDSAPASRVGDFQACPLICSPSGVPHVGGPILSGSPNVIICGMPAARVGDPAHCNCGGNPAIASGSATVLINGLPAARLGDVTTHGGTIQQGCGTVLIGP